MIAVKIPRHGLFKDLTSNVFGRLTVLSYAGRIGVNNQWNCKCTCGNYCIVAGGNLNRGSTKSCGCLHAEIASKVHASHKMTGSGEYRTWMSMKNRCLNSNGIGYINYGGRGIKVCDRWVNSFESFFSDMGVRPKGSSIERINNNGNYEPSNCRWATAKEQANNKRSNHTITINGVTKTMQAWADECGLHWSVIKSRISSGLSGYDLIKPSEKYKTLTFRGITDTYKGWSNRTGIKSETISQRIKRNKWTIERTLTEGATL